MAGRGPAERTPGTNRLDAHQPHEPLRPLAVDAELAGDVAAAVKDVLGVEPVDLPHQRQVLGAFPARRVVVGRARQAEKLLLAEDA